MHANPFIAPTESQNPIIRPFFKPLTTIDGRPTPLHTRMPSRASQANTLRPRYVAGLKKFKSLSNHLNASIKLTNASLRTEVLASRGSDVHCKPGLT